MECHGLHLALGHPLTHPGPLANETKMSFPGTHYRHLLANRCSAPLPVRPLPRPSRMMVLFSFKCEKELSGVSALEGVCDVQYKSKVIFLAVQ